MFMIGGALCVVVLPFQSFDCIRKYRHYERKPYGRSDLWFTIAVLGVFAGVVLAGLLIYYRIETGEEISPNDRLVMMFAKFCAGLMLLGVPYACFQYYH